MAPLCRSDVLFLLSNSSLFPIKLELPTLGCNQFLRSADLPSRCVFPELPALMLVKSGPLQKRAPRNQSPKSLLLREPEINKDNVGCLYSV